MSPLALRVLRQLGAGAANGDKTSLSLLCEWEGVHAFDCSAVCSSQIQPPVPLVKLDNSLFNLPFDKVFIETITHDNKRMGITLSYSGDFISGRIYFDDDDNSVATSFPNTVMIKRDAVCKGFALTSNNSNLDLNSVYTKKETQLYSLVLPDILWSLVCINTPAIAEATPRRTHRGFLRQTKVSAPADTWHEIKLKGVEPGPVGESYASGAQRRFHWCRAHLRVVNGRIVHVRSHTRGNASLGLVHASYKVG